jgi:hypothetical protein
MTTTGITTAMAVLPAAERPPLLDDLLPPGSRLALDDVAAAPEDVPEVPSLLAVVAAVGDVVLVMTTVDGGSGVPFDVAVTMEVTSWVVGCAEGAVTEEVMIDWVVGVVAVVAFVMGVVVSVVGSVVVVCSDVVGAVVTEAMISTMIAAVQAEGW